MSPAEIAAAVAEAAPRVVGGVVVRVRRPWPRHLAFEVRREGRNVELVVGVEADLARVHLARDLPPSPPGADPFTLRVRKAMRPGRVVALEQVGGDRVVALTVARRRDADDAPVRLVAELFGRGRMFLLDDAGRVVAWDGPGGARGFMPGALYAPPPRPDRPTVRGDVEGVPAEGLEARYRTWISDRARSRAAADLAARVDTARRRLRRRIGAIERDLAACAAAPGLRREAELLAAHRHLLVPGMAEVRVPDLFAEGAPERVIGLDPARSPEGNVRARFARARKAERGAGVLAERLEAARAALARLDAGEVPPPRAPRSRAPDAHHMKGVRRFRPEGGWEIWVGRGAAGNERLTFRLARGNDLWFHAREVSGAHVVLRLRGDAPERARREAALLAAHFSRLKQAGGGEVAWTEAKHVRRPGRTKGAAPGRVTVSRERVMAVRLDPDEVARLLLTRVPRAE